MNSPKWNEIEPYDPSLLLQKSAMDGRIKGRQRDYIPRNDITSPTISTEALMLSLAIDAHKEKHVATADIKGAHLHADMDDKVIVLFKKEIGYKYDSIKP